MKKCSHCNLEKDESSFGKNSAFKDGLANRCKPCANEMAREGYKRNPEKHKQATKRSREKNPLMYARSRKIACERMRELRKTNPRKVLSSKLFNSYGITLEQYEEKLKEQNYVCAICGSENNNSLRPNLSVDHDHITGKIRGLLCSKCNTAIGLLNDEIRLVKKVCAYLEEHQFKVLN